MTLRLDEGSFDKDMDKLRLREPSEDCVRDGDVVTEDEKLDEISFVADVD